jgi:hypothetical protein
MAGRNNGPKTTWGELLTLEAVGPEKWAEGVHQRRYWALLNAPSSDKATLTERIKDLRELYERAKADPNILKPMAMSLVDLELGLIKNIKWLKAGGKDFAAKFDAQGAEMAERKGFLHQFERLHRGSARAGARGRPSRTR